MSLVLLVGKLEPSVPTVRPLPGGCHPLPYIRIPLELLKNIDAWDPVPEILIYLVWVGILASWVLKHSTLIINV